MNSSQAVYHDYELEYEFFGISKQRVNDIIFEHIPSVEDGFHVTDIEYSESTQYLRVMVLIDDVTTDQYNQFTDEFERKNPDMHLVFAHQHDYTTAILDEDKGDFGDFHGPDIRSTFN